MVSELPLDLRVSRRSDRWAATALVPMDLVPAGSLRVNAHAAHGIDSERRFLAWKPVPGPRPDFHCLEVFAPLP